jgi:outer membrane protein
MKLNTKHNRLILLLNLLLITFTVTASDSIKSRFLSLDSAISMGIQHSHQVGMAGAQVTQAHSALGEVKDFIMPNVDVALAYTRLSNVPVEYFTIPGSPEEIPSTALFPIILNNYSATASLQESVFNGFQWKYGVVELQYNEKSAEYNYESKKKDVALNIITLYLDLFKLNKAHYLIKQSLEQINAHVKEISDFASHGLATQNDVLSIKLQLSNTQLSEIDINNQMQTINFNLDIMLGIPENTTIQIDTNTILSDKTIQPLPYYLQKFEGNRNDIQAASMQEKSAEANIKLTQSGVYPKLSIGADYNYLRPNPRIVPPLDQFQPSWDIGFRLSYSLTGLYENKNKAAESRAKLLEAQSSYDQLTDAAKMDINQSYTQYKQALEKTQVAESSLGQAKENYKIVKSKYDNHVSLVTDLLDANNYLLNAEINVISAKADAQLAYYSLLKAAGELATK